MLKTFQSNGLRNPNRRKIFTIGVFILLFVLIATLVSVSVYRTFNVDTEASGVKWRSELYPTNWVDGQKDSQGRYLSNFSYAGYQKGEKQIPTNPPGIRVDVTQSPYNADRTGRNFSHLAIQKAIDYVSSIGGGTVYLPAGTYKVTTVDDSALTIKSSKVVLKGDGPGKTFIYNDKADMRTRSVITFSPAYNFSTWQDGANRLLEELITKDVPENTNKIFVTNINNYKVGEWVLIKNSFTASFVKELGAQWATSEGVGLQFYRQITSINNAEKSFTVDLPIRFTLLTRDRVRINKIRPHIEEVGIQDLSIGNRENLTGLSQSDEFIGLAENDNRVSGTAAYEVHQSRFIQMLHVNNGWIKNVSSYRPNVNSRDVHILSKGVVIEASRSITMDTVNIQNAQYKGGGSNGYLFQITGNDNLIINSSAINGRHNYMMTGPESSGNVITNSITRNGGISSDHHGKMSAANLFDNVYIDNDVFHALWNPLSGPAGPTTSQTVYWNIKTGQCGRPYFTSKLHSIQTQQYKWGYVIGTSGTCKDVHAPGGNGTEPIDFLEGLGKGATLEPQSLYLDQLNKRLNQTQSTATPTRTPTPTQTSVPTATPTPTSTPINSSEVILDLEEGDGNNISDISGNITGTINGANWITRAYALNFDGRDDYVRLGGFTTQPTKNLTLSAWIAPTDLTKFKSGIISNFANGGYRLILDKNKLIFEYRDNPGTLATLQATKDIEADKWTHVAATFDGTTRRMKIYINGVLVGEKIGVNPQIVGKDFIELGRNADNNDSTGRAMFKGQIDDVKIYARTLSDAEIKNLMTN